MEYFDFDSIIEGVKQINDHQNYWMIRTMGGQFYSDFIRKGYVAIGYDEVTLNDIHGLSESNSVAKEEIKRILVNRREDINTNAGYYAAQILRFVREVRSGDIVIIPSVGAGHVAIGTVVGDCFEEIVSHSFLEDNRCYFRKRRRVQWRIMTRRSMLPPMLQLIFSSRHAISSVNNYAQYIDSVMNDCYFKDEYMHLVLRIRTQDEISMEDFFKIHAINRLVDDFCSKQCIGDEEALIMKIQMESPGWLRISTKNILKLLEYGLILTAITGGGLKYKKGEGFDLYTKGIPGAINDYLDRKADRGLVESAARAIDSLQISTPKDLQPIIEILEKKNEGREKY